MKRVLAVMIMLIMGLMGLPVSVAANGPPPLADYGDAPDPTFPSLYQSGGPFHLNLDDCWIGPGLTSTAEPNALVPDLDIDDGNPVLVYIPGPPGGDGEGWIFVPITLVTAGTRYLNILIDQNSSMSWGDVPGEWVSPNYRVSKSAGYWIGGFRVPNPTGQHWVRLTLSEVEINKNTPFGWDGQDTTGGTGFSVGETEDWLLEWMEIAIIPTTLKFVTVHQKEALPHEGPNGPFTVVVSNWSRVWPVTVIKGPFIANPPGIKCVGTSCPCAVVVIPKPGLFIPASTTIPIIGNTWVFQNAGPGKSGRAWGQLDIEIEDPFPEVIIISNVGTYDGDISEGPNGVEFVVEEVEVGGTVYPVDRMIILAPWIALAVILIVGGVAVVRRRNAGFYI